MLAFFLIKSVCQFQMSHDLQVCRGPRDVKFVSCALLLRHVNPETTHFSISKSSTNHMAAYATEGFSTRSFTQL